AHDKWITALCLIGASSAAFSQQTPPSEQKAPPAIRYESHISAGGQVPPGADLTNPHKGEKDAATNGGQLFVQMNCNGCHGDDAAGAVGPNLSDGRWRYGGADGEIFRSIYYGRPQGMPAFGGMLPPDAIWRLVTYLRSLPPPANVPTESFEQTQ
ncbi:MAG TPA: c-type cytochrome, partial [Burkholderiales bacterium]|nr:c-type cytochrome [Burkholderiales bacterium]